MSKYTTEVRFICETAAGLTESVGYGVSDIIQKAIPSVFNFDFPIYDESYRNVLCTKILKHYYTREIGAETVGLWKHWMDTRLNEIMPYYNQLYKSAMIEFNPMYDIDLTTTHTRDNGGTTDVTSNLVVDEQKNIARNRNENQTGNTKQTSHTNDNSVSRDLFSDTPQGALDNVENQTYLTNARKITHDNSNDEENIGEYNDNRTGDESVAEVTKRDGTNTGKTVATSTEEYMQTIRGKSSGASYSKRLQEFRSTFLNIDLMIINELGDLFMGLW